MGKEGGDLAIIALEPAIATAALLGFIGGVARVMVGMLKAISVKSKIYWSLTLATALASGFVGILLGVVFNFSQPLSLLAGFGGLDILDKIYQAFKVQKVIVVSESQAKKISGGSS